MGTILREDAQAIDRGSIPLGARGKYSLSSPDTLAASSQNPQRENDERD